jgi:hypothetical protein
MPTVSALPVVSTAAVGPHAAAAGRDDRGVASEADDPAARVPGHPHRGRDLVVIHAVLRSCMPARTAAT